MNIIKLLKVSHCYSQCFTQLPRRTVVANKPDIVVIDRIERHNDYLYGSPKTRAFKKCDDDLTLREVLRSNPSMDSNISKNGSNIETKNKTLLNQTNESRKSGICQNDHGGPLVTWVGAQEVLIGVASVFRVSDDSRCMGPYLYTSTQCNGAFLDCIISNLVIPDQKNRRGICNSPPIQRGYDTIERFISWKNHPAGPAENEASINKKKFVVKKLSTKKGLIDRLNTKAGLSKALERFMILGKFTGNETVVIRPQRPLKE